MADRILGELVVPFHDHVAWLGDRARWRNIEERSRWRTAAAWSALVLLLGGAVAGGVTMWVKFGADLWAAHPEIRPIVLGCFAVGLVLGVLVFLLGRKER
ncbi:hypothetical protein [Acrocarpospora phusangensis]|uniref:hypothetical protein n=1 Tax=Acrocarpospora phusangensis TaxID=1070424 RepID=UPI00194FC2AD|nr:hypothetical protein [Acrocarpospora phusangensis]